MEHHANIVPWQMAAQRAGLTLRVAPINERGELILEELDKLLTPKTKLLTLALFFFRLSIRTACPTHSSTIRR
jgi:cysteine desulfurase/selenocysteine lyase